MMGSPKTVYEKSVGGGSGGRIPGSDALEMLVASGLTVLDGQGTLRPVLAEAVPSIENGLWRVFPDGRMETTWKIRPGAVWHDGVPVTSEDFAFNAQVEQDKDLPFERNLAYNTIDRIEAPDPQTVTVSWKRVYIEADDLFSRPWLPRHLLEQSYTDNKENFITLPYWNSDFVGTGPYKVGEWVRDSYIRLQANDQYVLGRPKIDQIELRFIPDERAFMATILSGGIDMSIGKSITLEQAIQVRDLWPNGHVLFVPETAMKIWPQFVNPNPAIVADVQLRKAVVHAIDRQEMVDSIMNGQSSVAHTVILPTEAELAEVDASLVKYQYDPRRAVALIEGLGYAKGADGLFRGSDGQPLTLEISSTDEDQNTKPMFAVADYWKRVGIAAEPVVIPIQRQQDREYRATFPAFTLQGGNSGMASLKYNHSTQARLPQNNFTGNNYSRYMNPEFDNLLDTYFATVPHQPRMETLRQVVHHMTDQLNQIDLYYAPRSVMVGNHMLNVDQLPWNANQWDVK